MTVGRSYTVDVIAGDGIGQEVVPAAIRCVDAVAADARVRGQLAVAGRGGRTTTGAHGRMMPVDGIEQLADGDAILLGAVGAPDIPDDVTLWGLLIPIRREFLQYVNLRPVRMLPGVLSPLRDAEGVDMLIVRENVEGEYSEVGGRLYRGRPEEMAVQEAVFTRTGVSRVAAYAVAQAQARRGLLTSATKSNGIIHTMPFWDEVVAEVVGRGRGSKTGQDAGRCPCRPGRAPAAQPGRDRRLQPVRRHPLRPGRRGRRVDRGRPERQHQPAAGPSVDVRTGARVGPGHRRPGHREPGRPDVGGRDDARAPRRGRGGRRR